MSIDFGVFLQILCYCKFPLSHCHQYCHHRRIRPCWVTERAPVDVRAILYAQNLARAHAGLAVPTVLHQKFSVAEYQGALGPTTETPVPTAGPTLLARAAACPQVTCYPMHSSPVSPLTLPHHDLISVKTSPKSLLPDREMRLAYGYGGSLPATCLGTRSQPQAMES